MACDTSYHNNMPEELLVEIFLRSSVESLVRAKCVCKQWYNIIKSPNFALDHVEYQKSHNKGRLLLQYKKEKYIAYALFDDETLEKDEYHDIDPLMAYPCALHMEGPINGLYCLYNFRDRIALWNPALKELRTLPLPHFHFLPHEVGYTGSIGFGIDPLTHDYKLVLFRPFEDSTYITVYYFRTNIWRLVSVDDLDLCCISESLCSSFLDGTYYWFQSSHAVVAFDMGNENFRKIPGPEISDPAASSFCLTLSNSAKVALLHRKPFVVDIWVMLEEGVWIKQFSFTSLIEWVSVLGLWKNHGLLFAANRFKTLQDIQAVLYNADTHEMRKFGPIVKSGRFRTSTYYESLVSVDCVMGHKERCISMSHFLLPFSNPYSSTLDFLRPYGNRYLFMTQPEKS